MYHSNDLTRIMKYGILILLVYIQVGITMKKLLRKLFLPCMIFGSVWAEITLYILLRQSFSPISSLFITFIPLIPFLFYGIARISKAGKIRRLCNLIGASLLSADCYFMIVTAFCGLLFLLGLPLSYASIALISDHKI